MAEINLLQNGDGEVLVNEDGLAMKSNYQIGAAFQPKDVTYLLINVADFPLIPTKWVFSTIVKTQYPADSFGGCIFLQSSEGRVEWRLTSSSNAVRLDIQNTLNQGISNASGAVTSIPKLFIFEFDENANQTQIYENNVPSNPIYSSDLNPISNENLTTFRYNMSSQNTSQAANYDLFELSFYGRHLGVDERDYLTQLGNFNPPLNPYLMYVRLTNEEAELLDFSSSQDAFNHGILLNHLGNLASAPGSPSENDIYNDTTLGEERIYDGSSWSTIGTGAGEKDIRVGFRNLGSISSAHGQIMGLPAGNLQEKADYANLNYIGT